MAEVVHANFGRGCGGRQPSKGNGQKASATKRPVTRAVADKVVLAATRQVRQRLRNLEVSYSVLMAALELREKAHD